ncbi:MAG: hemerythrin family protein [Gammaproteobacteria bacterium]|nr:hemerythrin family protein [Gammaproteobacteria bacterium]
MTKKKGVLQKTSVIIAYISYVLAVASGVFLYFRLQTENIDNPISSSLAAMTFFFICVGIVLSVMGSADLPSLKIDEP